MLTNLHISSFVLIDNLDINFKEGMSVITGETGAGKSLIIDAISMLNGAKTSNTLIRIGAEKAIVQGVFDNIPVALKDYLEQIGLERCDELILRREINISGKSTFRVNGEIVPLKQADEICDFLFDIHVQHDTLRLFNPKYYLSYLESSETKSNLAIYKTNRINYLNVLNDYNEIVESLNKASFDLDYIKFQYNELSNAELKIGEKEELEENLKVLNNYESISENLSNIKSLLDNENSLNNLYEVLDNLKKLSESKKEYINYVSNITDAYYSVEDLLKTVSFDLSNLEYDEAYVNKLNEKINLISNLERKYHTDVAGLLEIKDKLKLSIDNAENKDYYKEQAYKKVEEAFIILKESAINLSNSRIKEASLLKEEVIKNLHDLLLDKVEIKFVINSSNIVDPLDDSIFKADGVDTFDILVSFNPGEALNSLSKVASGGEMSRMMLALKAALFKNREVELVIFDEIDSGVSGKVADSLAHKLKEMSNSMQIFSITHLPIVASIADSHIEVSKEVIDGKTIINLAFLSFEERIKVLAQMIAPNDTSGKSLEVARELLEQNK